MATNIVASFYEAMRKGQVVDITGRQGGSIYATPIKAMKMTAMPSFDFGHLNNPPAPEAWDKALYDDLWAEWIKRQAIGLPFPACIYVFRFHETAAQYETINLMVVEQLENGFRFDTYFWQPNAPGSHARWTHHPVVVDLEDGRMMKDYGYPLNRFDAAAQADYDADAQSNYTAVIAATLLMNRSRTVEREDTGGMAATNIGRAKGRLAPLPDTIAVKLGDVEVAPRASRGGTHASPMPHDRRSHYRKRLKGVELPPDRWIKVKASRPNGGSDESRNYRVQM